MSSSPNWIITIGASAGGIEALQSLVRELPSDLPAAVLVVLHLSADSPGVLPMILGNAGALPASHPTDREVLMRGRLYVAPPDQHVLVEPSGRIRLSRGPKENRFRPAIDPLFRSAAHAFGSQVIGVVLTGALDDGTAGLWAIERHGGVTIVQDPKDAAVPSMPLNALRYVDVDHCLPIGEIGPLLARLAMEPPTTINPPEVREMDLESKLLLGGISGAETMIGKPSFYACPACHGTLQEIEEGRLVRYRCHVGHAYSRDVLLSELTQEVSETLWNAVRAIEESARLLRQEAEHAHTDGNLALSTKYLERTKAAKMDADAVKVVVMRQQRLTRDLVEKSKP